MKRYKNSLYFLLSLLLSASFLLFTGIGTNAAQIILRGISGYYSADLLSKVFPPKNVLPAKTTSTKSAKAGALLPAIPACGAATVTRSSPPYIYIDTADLTNAGAEYIAYKICNDTGAAIADAWIKLTSSSAIITLAANEDGLYHIGPLAMNACATVYFYVKASSVTGTTQNLTVEVYEGNPTGGGTLVCGNNVFGYTVEDVIDANANKPMSVTVSGDTNSCFTVTATGATGNIGSHNNSNITYTPAASLSWPADAYELTDVNFTYPNAPVGGVNDVLWVENLTSSNEGNYTVTYTFCKRQSVALPSIMPYTYIASGSNNNKYGPVDPQVTVTLSAMKSVSPTGLVAAGSTLTYTITVTNTGASKAATGMTLTDAIPANTTYVAGSTTLNGAAVADNAGPTMPYSTAREIHSPGEPNGTINPGETATVTFQVTVNNPVPAGVTSVSNFATYAGTGIPSTNTNTVTNSVCNPPTPATVGGPQTICALGTTAGLGGNTPSIGTGTWSIVSGGTGTFSPNATTPNATFTHTGGAGPVVLRWTISNGACADSTADVTITITQPPTTATAGADQSICALGTTAGLGGNTPSVGTGTWSIVSGGTGTFSPNANSPNATFTHTGGAGPVVLRWTISNGSCTPSTDDVTINITSQPTQATVGGTQTICESGTTMGLGGNTPSVGSGMWSIVSGGTGTFSPDASTPNATFTHTGGVGPVVLRWTISNGSCTPSTADVTVNITPQPTTATVGGPQTICALGTTAGLGGNTPTVGTGMWSVVSGGTGTFSPNATTPNATFTHTSGTGPIVLRWTISNGTCTDSTADVTITITQPPTQATVGGTQTICALGMTAGLGGNTPSNGTGMWSIVSGGTGTFSPDATTPNATFTHTGGAGPVVLRWTISNGSCTPSSADVTINITPQPTTATVGGPQTICALGTTTGLGGNTPSNGTGMWSVVSGGTGTFSDATSPNATFTHTGGMGPVVLRWTISNGACTPSTADVTITITQPPTQATVGGPQTICALGTTAGLGGNTPSVGTGMWSVVSGGTGTFSDATSPNATFTHTGGVGPVLLRWTISNGSCTPSTADVTITITQPPTPATAGGPQTICALGTTAGLGGNTPSVGTGMWSIVSGGTGTFTPNATSPNATFTHTGGVGPVVLRWTISNGVCADSTADVTVTITQPPTTATVGANQTICALSTTAGLGGNTPSVGTGTWSIVSGGTGTFSPNATTPNATFTHTGGAGPVVLRWTISNGVCADSTADVTINITPQPTQATVGGAQTICALGTTTGLGGNTPSIGTGMWSIVSGGTGTFTPNATTPNATFTHTGGTGPVVLRWTISNGSCTPSTADVTVTISQPPTVADAGPDQQMCGNGPVTLAANTPLVGTGTWSVVSGGTGTFTPNANTPNATFTPTGGAVPYTLRWTISNSPCNDSIDEVELACNVAAPMLTLKIVDPIVCNGPGGLTSATGILTNPNNTPQQASFTVTLPPQLTALQGTCNASINPGGCVIAANGSSVTWNGTIPAGQSVTIAYQAQIAANIPQGTQLCVDATGTVGGAMVNLTECLDVNCPSCLLPGTANVNASQQKAGSLLVFPYYVSKAAEQKNTRLTISNVGTQQALVHLFLIDGTSCNPADLFLCLTPNATFSFTALDYDPENTGFIYAVAVNNEGRPIPNNVLIGNAFVKDGDYVDNYGAEAFWRHDTAITNIAGGFAVLGLNGTQYDAAPIQFAVEIQSPVDAVGQKIVVAPVSGDLTAGQANLGAAFPALMNAAAQNCVGLAANADEKTASFGGLLSGGCLKTATLTTGFPRVPTGLGGLMPTGKGGTLSFRVGAGVGLFMTPRTGTNRWHGIRALHKTAAGNVAIAIPVFIPTC